LNMVKGDHAAARKAFDDMLKPEFKPAPGFGFAYEARYFRAVNEILDKKPDAAKKAMADLLAWQQKTPPPDPKLIGQMSAAASMLEYRIDSLQADMVADAKAKADFNAAARKVLMKLQAEHPEFRSIISDLSIARLPDNASMTELDALML